MQISQTSDDLSLIRFHGADAAKFLQGYLTADTSVFSDIEWQLTALCNLKGRVIASGWAQATESGVDWVVHRSLSERVVEFLSPYLRFAKTEALVLQTAVYFSLEPTLTFITESTEGTQAEEATDSLYNYLFRNQIVLIDSNTTEKYLPQMVGLVEAGAVSFDKGCYLGQEVVARAQHRGAVKRRLAFAPTSDEPSDSVVLRAPEGFLAVQRVSSASH